MFATRLVKSKHCIVYKETTEKLVFEQPENNKYFPRAILAFDHFFLSRISSRIRVTPFQVFLVTSTATIHSRFEKFCLSIKIDREVRLSK